MASLPTTRLLASRSPFARRPRTSRPLPALSFSPFVAQRYHLPAKCRNSIRTIATTRSAPNQTPTEPPTADPAPSSTSTSTTSTSAPSSSSTTKASPSASKSSSTTKTPSTALPIQKSASLSRARIAPRTVTSRSTPTPSPPPPPPSPATYPDVDWATSYYGVGGGAFSPEATAVLRRPIDPADVEIKPDGIVFLPEIKYRAILLEAFGAGGWGMVPKGEPIILDKLVVREWALIVHGRFVSQARGENNYFGEEQIPRAIEATKSNALMRCCKDLGVAAELWDKRYVSEWKETYCQELWVEHVVTKKRARIFLKKDDKVEYPFKVTSSSAPAAKR